MTGSTASDRALRELGRRLALAALLGLLNALVSSPAARTP
jgi:hypothetical protein